MSRTHQWIYFLVHGVLLLAGLLVYRATNTELGHGVGSSIVATGVAGLVVFLYVLSASRTSALLEALDEAGLCRIFKSRSMLIKGEYEHRLSNASERIDAIGFGLRALREDHLASFGSWATKCKVRILLLDPEYPDGAATTLARIRDVEEHNSPGEIEQEVRAFVRSCSSLRTNVNFQIRLYRAIPSLNYFRVDDEAFWGPYLLGGPSRNTPTLLVRSGGFLFRRLADQFDGLWNSPDHSREPPADWWNL